jgi:hypothetical protein
VSSSESSIIKTDIDISVIVVSGYDAPSIFALHKTFVAAGIGLLPFARLIIEIDWYTPEQPVIGVPP